VKYFPKVSGERVYLSPISMEDAEVYTEWLNDLRTARFLTVASMNISLQSEREALPRLSSGHNYAIVTRASDELLGNCGLSDIEDANRSAELGIFIGSEAYRGQGYGTEALRLLCDYAFNALNLRSLMLRVYDYNERAMSCYRKVGFKEIGRRRKARFYAGAYHDVVLMDLLYGELSASVLPPADCQ
jgi:RimJ/RimL family protein N-acetyltransferase